MPYVTTPEADAANAAMERYSNGDDSAFADVYDAIAPRLLGFLRKATRDDAASEDLMQQTLLQMHRARGSFLPGAPVLPWALAIAKRLMIDRARRRHLELDIFSDAPLDEERMPSHTAATTDDELDARRTALRVQERLDSLPESQRAAYRLVKEEGLSLRSAAKRLGTSVPAVKLRTHRAYQALRALFREEGGAE